MATPRRDSLETSSDDPVPTLESHIRSLILTNAAGPRATRGGDEPAPEEPLPAQKALPLTAAANDTQNGYEPSADVLGEQKPPPPRASRRRPNQAQSRQMSSQLSIPIGPRSQDSQPALGRQGNLCRTPPSGPRHVHGVPQPTALDWSAGQANASSFWRTSRPTHFTNASRNLPSGQYGRQDAPPFRQGPSSVQASRYGPCMPQSQHQQCLTPQDVASQADFLERLCYQVVSKSEIGVSEIAEKEAFRQHLEAICRDVISRHEQNHRRASGFHPLSVELRCFGSLSSGFATKASDMDLGLLSPLSEVQPDATGSPIPRLLERAFLDAGLGARLLSRTRVPIIKLCEKPSESLRQALLAERESWEGGIENNLQDVADDEELEQDTVSQNNSVEHADPKTSDVTSLLTVFEIPCPSSGRTKRLQLKQGPNLTLSAYYALAKRILRQAGGREVTLSNYRDFTAPDWKILNCVCQAFVQGLYDDQLRERLAAYPSLSFQSPYDMPQNRSLLGVFTQVHGEQTLQLWAGWPCREAIHYFQPQAEEALLAWNEIQWRVDFGLDPISYTRDLQLALDKVKAIPSVQLVLLEQGQYETPSQYSVRARGLLKNLRRGSKELSDAAQDEFNRRYVSGILDDDVRAMVEAFVAHSDGQVNFEEVGQAHKCYHLSWELEKTIEAGKVDAANARDIADYIKMLRSPFRRIFTGPLDCRFVIPAAPESTNLLFRIMKLQESHEIVAPTQPRDRYRDPLELPTSGAGVLCDINFSAHLALHNTALLRCYSRTDHRVRPMVLFVKHWAKVRGINSGYRGTLSSYGYVLMVLHYLVNVVQPFVCPNLQQLVPRHFADPSPAEMDPMLWCRGYDVQFWRNENEIMYLAANNQLNHNAESIGHLLRGFFEYFAQNGAMSNGLGRGFDWGRDVLSLRTQGGLLTKQEKGWTGAKTVFEVQETCAIPNARAEQISAEPPLTQPDAAGSDSKSKPVQPPSKGGEVKEIRHRYLFAIEDPFELDHNVARTVTHNGIVSIRDEFRRAWRIIRTAEGAGARENLLQDVKELQKTSGPFLQLLEDIHGPRQSWGIVQ